MSLFLWVSSVAGAVFLAYAVAESSGTEVGRRYLELFSERWVYRLLAAVVLFEAVWPVLHRCPGCRRRFYSSIPFKCCSACGVVLLPRTGAKKSFRREDAAAWAGEFTRGASWRSHVRVVSGAVLATIVLVAIAGLTLMMVDVDVAVRWHRWIVWLSLLPLGLGMLASMLTWMRCPACRKRVPDLQGTWCISCGERLRAVEVQSTPFWRKVRAIEYMVGGAQVLLPVVVGLVLITYPEIEFKAAALENPKFGKTGMIPAAWLGRADVVESMLEHGVDPNDASPLHTPLMLAALRGDMDLARALVDHGAQVDLPAWEGDAPLHAAAWAGKTEMVEYLLKLGADPNLDGRFWPPLVSAINEGREAVVRQLLDAGADPTAMNCKAFAAAVFADAPSLLWMIAGPVGTSSICWDNALATAIVNAESDEYSGMTPDSVAASRIEVEDAQWWWQRGAPPLMRRPPDLGSTCGCA